VHVHAEGQDFDSSAKQTDKMKMKTVALVSIMPFLLDAGSLGVVIQTDRNSSKLLLGNSPPRKFNFLQTYSNVPLECELQS